MENMEYFKRGTVISMSHASMSEPTLTVVQKIEGHNLYFKLPMEFLKRNVFKGDKINAQVFGDEYELVINGIISDIDFKYPNYVQVCVDRIDKYRNKREFRRYMVNMMANVTLAKSDYKIYSVVKNIGFNGAGIVIKDEIPENDSKKLKIITQVGEKDYLEFTADIIRAESRGLYNEYGVKITYIDDMNKDILDKLIYKMEKDESLYVKESLK
ncbi:PilZ domain-containing protein [Pseudobacteroides cellulosolvens]|uniref:Type IV pilus assembly PilZ n=1 Tax=Pseudobacteroides cellulosolvens ATCC 35603 = DSM 2933 TaxID=398512 RepID=A0A0L6JHH2_9FIRM|nr:PilZ domain-containing protein [Pseudobacteroides cellulosolvens]KNY25286.1 type IV pilus assembly PilZ [Pseudobacteroides cellulosolvens ATCC 35603 = DSM 2933]